MVIAIGLASVACGAERFTCSEDGECVLGGEPGVCVAGNCAYVDAMCASGYRYAAGLGNALASECVEEGDAPDSDTENATGSSGSTIDPSTPSSSSTTESDDESSSTTSMSSTGANDCTNPSCESCLECAVGSMGSCAKEYALCEYIQGCQMGHACLQACLSGMVCEECCSGLSPSAIEAMYAVIACQQTACNDNCGTFPPLDCEPI
jgi:hypothetical protein